MKKIKTLKIILAFLIVLSACGGKKAGELGSGKEMGKKRIGIVQFIEHPSLDLAREGFEEGLKKLGIDCDIDYKSAQGNIDTAKTICEKFASDRVDLIYAIATPAAQMAKAATGEIPIIFAAVTDPVSAELVSSNDKPGANITGVSDAVDVKLQLELFSQLDADIKNIGVIYSADEANSIEQVNKVKKASRDFGLNIFEKSIQNLSDLPQTVTSLAKKVDAIYIPSDNKISNSISLLAETLVREKIPSICTTRGDIEGGMLLTMGIDYKNQGAKASELAKKVLVDKINPGQLPVTLSEKLDKLYNLKTARDLGLDENKDVFKDAIDVTK